MPATSSRRLLKALFVLSLLAAVALGGWFWVRYQGFADAPIALAGTERILVVESGDGFRDILRKLRGLGVVEGHDLEWKALAHEMQVVTRLQVGEYTIRHGITPRELLAKLESGKVIQQRFTIVEGWNLRELRAALAKDKALADAWAMRSPDSPLKSPDELLVLASIVEKETGKASERAEIAGVFTRRLVKGMLLQTDPTVIYGMGSAYDGNIRRKDLETDTPYNTYTRAGLPPTPIALPGRAALVAAARPADGDTLYFVSRGDGSHVFSATLAEHNRAVACHQLKRCR